MLDYARKKLVPHPKKEAYGLALALVSTCFSANTCFPEGMTSL